MQRYKDKGMTHREGTRDTAEELSSSLTTLALKYTVIDITYYNDTSPVQCSHFMS